MYMVYMQVRQLVLDPAIQQEFARLRRELEEQRSTIAQLKEQNDSLTFTAVSLLRCCVGKPGQTVFFCVLTGLELFKTETQKELWSQVVMMVRALCCLKHDC
jgi:hypothetical protein